MNGSNYVSIAQILAGDLATSTTEAERLKVRNITLSLADYFTRSDPRFVRSRFYATAGVIVTDPVTLQQIRDRWGEVDQSDLIAQSDFRRWAIDTHGKQAWRDYLVRYDRA